MTWNVLPKSKVAFHLNTTSKNTTPLCMLSVLSLYVCVSANLWWWAWRGCSVCDVLHCCLAAVCVYWAPTRQHSAAPWSSGVKPPVFPAASLHPLTGSVHGKKKKKRKLQIKKASSTRSHDLEFSWLTVKIPKSFILTQWGKVSFNGT